MQEYNSKTLNDRMKDYEKVYSNRLDISMPVIIRVDGKNFSRYTKYFQKPFDMLLTYSMQYCAEKLASELQGFRVAYHQSDEISFLLTKGDSERSDIAFGGKVNKINSLCASYMSGYFNNYMKEFKEVKKLAFFDCRCFNVPESDVSNYFLYRAKDYARNSVTMLAREYFSHSEMHKRSKDEVKTKLFLEKNVDWNKLNDDLKHGTFITKSDNCYLKNNITQINYQEIEKFIKKYLGPKK